MDKICFESLFESLCQQLKTTNDLEIISRSFMQQTSDRERIRFLLNLDVVEESLQLPNEIKAVLSAGGKSSKVATQKRNDGNHCFKAKNYIRALSKYTESLSYSPQMCNESGSFEDSAASLAYANRSAALFQLKKYQSCLDDIDRAFGMNYPLTLAYKLHDRKGHCLLALGQHKEAGLSFATALDALKSCDLEPVRRQQWQCELRKHIQSCEDENAGNHEICSSGLATTCHDIPEIPECRRNARYQSLSDACDVACDSLLGRHVIAKCDILPGDVILVEKPYASVMLADSRLDHCSYCYKFTLAPISCPSCCHSLFCSPECQSLAYKLYHKIECPLGEILEKSGVDKFAMLAIRTLVTTSHDIVNKCGASGVLDDEKRAETDDSDAGNFDVYRADSYEAICGLVTHAGHRNAHDLFRRAVIAIFLLRCLCFAGYFETENPSVDVLSHAGGLLLSHLQSFPCNAHETAEFDLVPEAVATSVPHELGAGIYATLSLFNHSCDPAVTRNFYGDVCVVRAIRSVRAGEELSDNYGAVFAMQPRMERRAKLQRQYFFECQCTACVEDWPLFSELRKADPKWHRDTTCGHCGSEVNVAENMQRLHNSDAVYKAAFDKLLNCQVGDALPDLLSHLRVMDEILCPPFADYGACQEAVKQCFSIMANCKCIKD